MLVTIFVFVSTCRAGVLVLHILESERGRHWLLEAPSSFKDVRKLPNFLPLSFKSSILAGGVGNTDIATWFPKMESGMRYLSNEPPNVSFCPWVTELQAFKVKYSRVSHFRALVPL